MGTRRQAIAALAALAVPCASRAQSKTYRVGVLGPERASDAHQKLRLELVRAGLRDLGYAEGRNLVIDARFAEGNYRRLPALADELVALKVDVIVALGSKAAEAAHRATLTVPIVVASGGDVIGLGLSSNLARPSSNVTGWFNVAPEVSTKLIQLVKEAAPHVTRVAYLVNPANPPTHLSAMQAAAASLKVGFNVFEAREPGDLDAVFARIVAARWDAVVVQGDTMFGVNVKSVTDLALRHRLASASALRNFAEAGGLLDYGPDRLEGYRRAPAFVDKLLKGAKPADLPTEQPTRFDLVINVATAKALGLAIPQSLAVQARLI